MKSQVLHTVWCHISAEAAGEIWNWSLLGVKGLELVAYRFEVWLAKTQQEAASSPHTNVYGVALDILGAGGAVRVSSHTLSFLFCLLPLCVIIITQLWLACSTKAKSAKWLLFIAWPACAGDEDLASNHCEALGSITKQLHFGTYAVSEDSVGVVAPWS